MGRKTLKKSCLICIISIVLGLFLCFSIFSFDRFGAIQNIHNKGEVKATQEKVLTVDETYVNAQYIVTGNNIFLYDSQRQEESYGCENMFAAYAQTNVLNFNNSNNFQLIFLKEQTTVGTKLQLNNSIASIVTFKKLQDNIEIVFEYTDGTVTAKTSVDAEYILGNLAVNTNSQISYVNKEFIIGEKRDSTALMSADTQSNAQILSMSSGDFTLSGDKAYTPQIVERLDEVTGEAAFVGKEGRAIYLSGGTLTIEGVTFDGFYTLLTLDEDTSSGGAIKATGGTLNLNCNIYNCFALSGGAISANDAYLYINGGNYCNNSAFFAGVIVSYFYDGTFIYNANFQNNFAIGAGGVAFVQGKLFVSDCTFNQNYAGMAGGAMCTLGTLIQNCNFTKNFVKGYIGFEECARFGFYAKSAADIVVSTFEEIGLEGKVPNRDEVTNIFPSAGGGALYVTYEKAFIQNCLFEENYVNGLYDIVGEDDPAFYLVGSAGAAVGGAIYSEACDTQITASTFNNNTVTSVEFALGGAVMYSGGEAFPSSDCVYRNNSVTSEGGLAFGGAIATDYDEITIINNVFSENTADMGGAIVVESGAINIFGGSFTKNTATSSAGVLGIKDEASITIDMVNDDSIVGTWLLNDELTTANINFRLGYVCDNTTMASFIIDSEGIKYELILAAANMVETAPEMVYSFESNSWLDEKYKTITILRDTENTDFIDWLRANAIKQLGDTSDPTFIENSTDGQGGVIGSTATENVIINSGTFMNNTASNGGVAAIYNGNLIINGGTYTLNSATTVGGVFAGNENTIEITGGEFSQNSAVAGGVVYMLQGETTISNATFTSNTASVAGVVYTEGVIATNDVTGVVSKLTINSGTFTANSATDSSAGGGVVGAMKNCEVEILDGTFTQNTTAGSGGVVGAMNSNVTIYTGTFTKNTAETAAGVVGLESGLLTIKDGDFTYNSTDNLAGCFGYKGYVYNGSSGVVIEDGLFENNFAILRSGVVYVEGNGVLNISGGTFLNNEALELGVGGANYSIIKNALFKDNRAGMGGCLYISEFEIENCRFEGNNSGLEYILDYYPYDESILMSYIFSTYNGGGALSINGSGEISNCTFIGNYTKGAIVWGGAVWVEGTVEFIDCTLTENQAISHISDVEILLAAYGYLESVYAISSIHDLMGGDYSGPQFVAGGGIICGYGNVGFTECDVYNNTADGNHVAGGGVAAGYCYVNIEGGSFYDNIAKGSRFDYNIGGVISVAGGAAIDNVTMTNNEAAHGGAIHLDCGSLYINGGTFSNNTGVYGGVVGATPNGWFAYANDGQSVEINGGTFTNNTGVYGGAIAYYTSDSSHSFTINGGTFTNNTATEGGVAYMFEDGHGYAEISGGTFNKNSAVAGGVVYAVNNPTYVNDGVFTENTAQMVACFMWKEKLVKTL